MPKASAGTILVVDDDAVQRELYVEILERAGYECVQAEDGEHALDRLQGEGGAVEAVLLDRRMPRLDGLETLKRLKADERLASLPVILQTAGAEGKDIQEIMAAGAYYYLPKSVRSEMLVATVFSAVENRRRLRELMVQLREASRTLTLMDLGRFRFRTPEEAKSLTQVLAAACPDPEHAAIGLSELLLNAVEHGNLEMSYEDTTTAIERRERWNEIRRRLDDPRYRDRFAELRFERLPGRYRILIRDQGRGFDWDRFLRPSPERAFDTHGRGVCMAAQCFDRLEYLGNGNAVTVEVFLPEPWPSM
ncbi:MAG TPA: response regulator [Holophagaceae bacterium]|nr:response regulator [Holophagaceae bacterium]